MDKKKAVGYVRVSDDKLLPNEIDKQTTAIKKYLEQLKGYELIDIYTDVGLAREGGNHLASFERMLQDAESHKFDCIITVSTTRMTRDSEQLITVVEHLHDIGIEVCFIKENVRTTDIPFSLLRSMADVDKQKPKLKVVGYAYISPNTISASFESEKQYLQDEIAKHPEWELKNTYCDQGYIGKARRRLSFEEMLEDAEEHKFDMVVVKNFRRFCLDAEDAITPLQRLTDAQVAVYFIKDGISSADEEFQKQFELICAIEEKERELRSLKRRQKKD